jgi:acyl carrier protein
MADRNDAEKRVIKVVSQVLKIEQSKIKLESNFIFDLGAESVDSIALIAGFEKEFNLEIDEESALQVQTVGNAVDYIVNVLQK